MLDAYTQVTLTIGDENLRVLSFSLNSEVNELNQLDCEVDGSLSEGLRSASHYLGQSAVFSIRHELTNQERHFRGLVEVAQRANSSDGVATLALSIAPALLRAKFATHSRTFLDQTLESIVQDVLSGCGVKLDIVWNAELHKQTIGYCVQFEETDYNFFRRILAREGLSWWVQETSEESKLVIFEKLQAVDSREAISLAFQGTNIVASIDRPLTHAELSSRITPNHVSTSGYDPLRPSLRIENSSDTGGSNEIYCPLKSRPDPSRCERKTSLLLDSQLRHETIVSGETVEFYLDPTQHIEILAHPYEPLNRTFVLEKIRIAGSRRRQFAGDIDTEKRQACRFVAVLENASWAPHQDYEKPLIPGLQTATTTGASGEDIDVDEHARATVAFHWDQRGQKDNLSSAPFRTAQLPTAGAMLLPRVGWEVTVAYHEGDVEEPIVISRLYNGTAMPPYSLPENALRSSLQTATTPGDGSSNEIRMSDVKGDEQMFFNASKDMSVDVGNNATHSVGNDRNVTVGVDQSLVVIDSLTTTVGSDQTISVTGNRKRSVTSLAVEDVNGDYGADIGANLTQMIGGDHRRTINGSNTLNVGANSMSMTIGSVSIDAAGNLTHEVGAALVQMTAGSRSVSVANAKTESTGAAKVIVAKGVRSVEAGAINRTIGGALMIETKGDFSSCAGTIWGETAAGMSKVEANNITLEAEMGLTLTMGGATVSMTPASISITGAAVTIDGNLIQTSPMNLNN